MTGVWRFHKLAVASLSLAGASAAAAQQIGSPVAGMSGAIWADANNDGYVDGYVARGEYFPGRPAGAAPTMSPAAPSGGVAGTHHTFEPEWGILAEMAGKDFGARVSGFFTAARFRWTVPGEALLYQFWNAGEKPSECLYRREQPRPAPIRVQCRVQNADEYNHQRNFIERVPDGTIREVIFIDDPLWGAQGSNGGYGRGKEPGTYKWSTMFSSSSYYLVPIERLGSEAAFARQMLAATPAPQPPAPAAPPPPPPPPPEVAPALPPM